MIAIKFHSMIKKITIVSLMTITFDSVVQAQFLDGFFKRDRIQEAKARKARAEKAHSDVITTQGESKSVTQAVKRERRAEQADADVIEVNQGSGDVELNPFWGR